MTQRRIQADQMRLETPRILQPLEVKPTYEDNSLDQMNYRFAASLGQYLMFVYLFGIIAVISILIMVISWDIISIS